MQKHPIYTRARLARMLKQIEARIHPDRRPFDTMRLAGPVDRIPYEQAMKLKYKPAAPGDPLAPDWSTHWLKLETRVPAQWKGSEVVLLFCSNSEATLWIDGRSVQGLNSDLDGYENRPDARLLAKAKGGESLKLAVEIACNGMFGLRRVKQPPNRSPFSLEQVELARRDDLAFDIYHDLRALVELEAEQTNEKNPLDPTWGGMLLAELNRFCNRFDIDDRATWPAAHKIIKPLLARRNADVTHRVSAIGHAHIDTAWLWPLEETYRKCVRSFSSQTRYMDWYPEYKFACSQAQQYAWIKQRNPDLYRRIKARVKRGQWIPVGGTWIEPDCNIPSGESLCRQFLLGQTFFEKEFGRRCSEFWNPDVFGYNGQLPQIMKLAGIERFLTQKLSWNRFNRPHTQTFMWQGIDGSEVLAHFPPANTYNAWADIKQLRKQAFEYQDTDRSRHGMLLFGWGDGGGGPTVRMLEQLRRVEDLQGVPPVPQRDSDSFFELLEADCEDRLRMVGELYFELHRGTYTSQAFVKRGNRRSELLLHDVEFLAACAWMHGEAKYPAAKLRTLWELTLLNQFHDILPGSSIDQVYDDARRHYERIEQEGGALRDAAAVALGKALAETARGAVARPVNTTSFNRREVAQDAQGKLTFVDVPCYGIGQIIGCEDRVRITERGTRTVLENAHLRATLDAAGRLVSLKHRESGRETLAAPGNVLEIYRDEPTRWEAWDVEPQDLETGRPCAPATSCKVTRRSPLRAEVTYQRKVGAASTMKQVVRLDADAKRLEFHCDIDWQESRRWLKVAFPVNVRAMNATYEMPFGVVERPTHYNNAYDLAKFEVPGHKWADLSEHGFGVALLNESKYGYSTFGNTMRLSLLRATKNPDPNADIGRQTFAYALYPHEGGWQSGRVVAEAFAFNAPLVWTKCNAKLDSRPLFAVDDPNLVLDTVKRSEDGAGLVLRFYEAHGARGSATVRVPGRFEQARYCNVLEDAGKKVRRRAGRLVVPYQPYKIISIRLE